MDHVEVPPGDEAGVQTSPHEWERQKWRPWLCRHCYAPKVIHPRPGWVKARPFGDHRYLTANAPHFNLGW